MPVFRRFGRPGLLDKVSPEAVVSGTETMTARAVDHGPVPDLAGSTLPEQLASLTQLNAAGSISDEEFAQAKKLLLNGG
jgi:hypothetical protein